jgi:chromosome segregation ATPase
LITQVDLELLQQQLDLSIQQVQTISAERIANQTSFVQQQDELNQRLQVLTIERDAAVNQNVDTTRNLNEVRALLHTQTLESASLAQELERASSREREVTVEKESAIARALDLEGQLGPIQERVKELQGLTDGIPNLQQSLEYVLLEAKQLPVLQEQVKQSTNRIKSLEQELSTQEQKVVQMKTMEDSLQTLQLLADSIPSLKESRQKYFTACKQSRRDIIDLQSKLKVANHSFEEKTQQFRIDNKNLKIEIDLHSQKYDDICNDLFKCVEGIQTGSDRLNNEWKVAYQNVVSEACSVSDLINPIQHLINHINTKYCSDQDDLKKEHSQEVNALKDQVDDLRKTLEAKDEKIKNLNTAIGKSKFQYEKTLLDKSNLIKALSSDKSTLITRKQSVTEKLQTTQGLLDSKALLFEELKIKFDSVQVSI